MWFQHHLLSVVFILSFLFFIWIRPLALFFLFVITMQLDNAHINIPGRFSGHLSGFLVLFYYFFAANNWVYTSEIAIDRSNHRRCSLKKVFLKILQISQENTCARVSFLKGSRPRPAILLKKRLWHSCFPVKFAKFLKTPFYRTPPNDYFYIRGN